MSKVTICPICQNTILPERLEVSQDILSWLSQLKQTGALQSWLFYSKTIHEQAMKGTTAQIVTENIGVFEQQFRNEVESMQEQQRQFKEDIRKTIEEHLNKQRTVTQSELLNFSEALNKIATGLTDRFSHTLSQIQTGFDTTLTKVTETLTKREVAPWVKGKVGELTLLDELEEACTEDYIERLGGRGQPDIVAKPKYKGAEIGRTIIIEVKDVQNWSNKFIDQLQKYMDEYHTPFGIIATKDLPAESEVKGFSVSVDRYGIILVARYEFGALAYQILRKLLVALYLEGKETMDFQALFKDEEILELLEEAKGYTKYIRSIRRNVRDIEKDLTKMQEELDKKLDGVTYKIAMLQKT